MFHPMSKTEHNLHTAPDSRQALVEAIEAHIARTGLTRTGFGRAALGDASFLGRIARGSGVRLGTADKVLGFMGMEPLGPRFRREIEVFMAVTRTKPHLLGEQAMRDPSFVIRLRRGRSATLKTVDRLRAWMTDNASPKERAAVLAAVEDRLPRTCSGGAPAVPVEREEQGETEMSDIYMNTNAAAAFLGLSTRTLERYRTTGAGPVFHRFGNRVRYLLADLKAWAASRRMRSTSDTSGDDNLDEREGSTSDTGGADDCESREDE